MSALPPKADISHLSPHTVSLSPYRPVMPRTGGLVCKMGPTQGSNFSYDHSGVPHAGVGTGPARVVMASVAVSVLTCLALIYIVWCIRTGYGEHLIRRHGTCLK